MVHVQREVAINSCDLSGLFGTSIPAQWRVPLKIRCTTWAPGSLIGHREGEELTTSHAPEPDAASSGSDDDASEQSEAFSHEISRASSSGLASDERRALAVSASNWRTSKAPGARMLLPSAMHEMMPVRRESRSRRDQAQLTHDHDLSQPCSRSSCNISCLRPGWPAEHGGAAVIFTVHEAGPAARARCASGRSEAARWRAGGPDRGGLAVSSPVEALMLCGATACWLGLLSLSQTLCCRQSGSFEWCERWLVCE